MLKVVAMVRRKNFLFEQNKIIRNLFNVENFLSDRLSTKPYEKESCRPNMNMVGFGTLDEFSSIGDRTVLSAKKI